MELCEKVALCRSLTALYSGTVGVWRGLFLPLVRVLGSGPEETAFCTKLG